MKPTKTLKQLLLENQEGFRQAEIMRRQLRDRIHQEVWGESPLRPLAKQQEDLPPEAAKTLNRRFWDFL